MITGYPAVNDYAFKFVGKEIKVINYLRKIKRVFEKFPRLQQQVTEDEQMVAQFPGILRHASDESFEMISLQLERLGLKNDEGGIRFDLWPRLEELYRTLLPLTLFGARGEFGHPPKTMWRQPDNLQFS